MSASKKFPIPLSYFSIALGLFALGLSWRYGASVGLLPALAAESLLAAASVVWLLLVAAYLIKMFAYRNDFLSDLRDLVQCCFISAIPITAMLEGLALKPYQAGAAAVLIYVGVAGQLAFSMYRAACIPWRRRRRLFICLRLRQTLSARHLWRRWGIMIMQLCFSARVCFPG